MAAEPQSPRGLADAGSGFISISSSDDEHRAPSPKRKRPSRGANGSAGAALDTAPTGRSRKRTRRSSLADDGVADGNPEGSSEGDSEGDLEAKPEARGSEEGQVGGETGAASSEADAAARKAQGAARVFLPDDPPVFAQDSLSFRLPVFSQKRKGSWHARFSMWVEVFHASNAEHGAAMTPDVVRAAYKQYVDGHSGLRQAKRRVAKDASAKLEASGELAELLETLRSSASSGQQPLKAVAAAPEGQADGPGEHVRADGPSHSEPGSVDLKSVSGADEVKASAVGAASAPGDETQLVNGVEAPAMAHKKGVPVGDDALAQQRRYFPSSSDPAAMCLLCGRQGHVAVGCRDSVCRFCSKDDHWDFACPTIPTRCGKCHQLGHSTERCVEKLAMTKDEGLECFYCKAPDHLEDECTEWWRSFEPLALAVKPVGYLPSSCATCGSEEHFSGDCPQRQHRAVNPTWTLRNRNLYIDPASTATAIEESYSEVGKPRAGRQSELRIRGSAASRTHIQYESEDSDVEFLGQRASARKPKIGQIRVSSNIQMPNERRAPPPQFPPGPPVRLSSISSGQVPQFPPGPPGRLPSSSSSSGPPPQFPPGPPARISGLPPPPGARGSSLSHVSGPPPSLPSRPPVRSFHGVPPPTSLTNNFRGGFNGTRGGGRGRGARGGRGRGRGSRI